MNRSQLGISPSFAGLLARRRWGLGLAMLLNLALVAGAFAVTGTAFWLARPYGVDGVILRPEIIGVPTVALLFTLVLLAPSVRRGFRQERDPRLRCGEAGAPSPLRFGADESGASIDRRTRRLIGAPRVPPPPRCAIRPRAPPARFRPRASAARECECPQPSQVEGRAHEIPFPAHLRHAAEGEATKAHRPLDLRVPAKDVPYARGPKSAAGRRGRRRSPYKAPRAATLRATPPGCGSSRRARVPPLPA